MSLGQVSHIRVLPRQISAITLDGAISLYLDRKRARGAAAATLLAYGSDLRQYAEYVRATGQSDLIALMHARSISGWLDALNTAGVTRRSQSRKLSVLRGLVRHAHTEGWLSHDPTRGETVKFRARRVIAPEMDALLSVVDNITGATLADLRDRALLRLALDAGLRISEAASVDMPGCGSETAIDLRRRLVAVVAKGGAVDSLPINARTVAMIEAWLCARGEMAKPGEQALFVTQRGYRPTRQTLHKIFKDRAAAAGIAGCHWHLMRHRRVVQVMELGGEKLAQQFARHASLVTTSGYGHHADTVARLRLREIADLDTARVSR